MNAKDRLENALRDIHVLVSRSDPYGQDKVIINKKQLFAMIESLNSSIYALTEEYELTKQTREKALRDQKIQADKIMWDATQKAEDVYAASIMYTNEALDHVVKMTEQSIALMKKVQDDMLSDFEEQKNTIRDNQLELKSQLAELREADKYTDLIEERNREIAKEKELVEEQEQKESKLAGVKTEIRINRDYYREHGIEIKEVGSEEEKKTEPENTEEEIVYDDLDALQDELYAEEAAGVDIKVDNKESKGTN